MRYQQAVDEHRWEVPERYNIAADVCDRHPREKLAMVHEDFSGNVRELSWGELQDLSNQFANVLVQHGVSKGDRVAMLLPPTPETAAAFFGTWKTGAILLSLSILYGDDGIRHRVSDSESKVLVTNAANADRIERSMVEQVIILDDELLAAASTEFQCADTLSEDPAQLYYTERHHRPGQGDPARAPVPACARGVCLLPRRLRRRALSRDGGVGLGRGDLSADRSLALRRGPVRLPARGGLRSSQAALVSVQARGHQRVRYADGDQVDDGDRGCQHPLPVPVSDRVCRRRAAQPGGDQVVP